MKEIRIDSINNDTIIFATDRLKRPMDKVKLETDNSPTNEYEATCPFCRGNEQLADTETFRIENKEKWIARSIFNKYPILDELPVNIAGRHEVIIDTYKHNSNFYNMGEDEFKNMLLIYKNRYNNLFNKDEVKYVSIFKNYLRKAGASLAHPHSQIISLPIIPKDIENEIAIAKDYYLKNGISLYDKIINDEINCEDRVVYNGNSFLVIVPYASKYTGEVRILFKSSSKFNDISSNEIDELSQIFHRLFKNLYKENGDNPFNIYLHTYPKGIDAEKYYKSHIHIVQRHFNFGGFELGTGVYVASKLPEDIAKKIKF